VFDALATAVDQRVLSKCRFSQPVLQKVGFIQKKYVYQSSQVDQSFDGLLSCRVRSSFSD
jgi:hypothetical protein